MESLYDLQIIKMLTKIYYYIQYFFPKTSYNRHTLYYSILFQAKKKKTKFQKVKLNVSRFVYLQNKEKRCKEKIGI